MTTWERRDKRVLAALTNPRTIEGGFLSLGRNESNKLDLDLTAEEEHESILVLIDAGYVTAAVEYSGGGGALITQLSVTGRGMQALGEWPWFSEPTPSTLAAFLERLAEEAPTEQEARDARKVAAHVG